MEVIDTPFFSLHLEINSTQGNDCIDPAILTGTGAFCDCGMPSGDHHCALLSPNVVPNVVCSKHKSLNRLGTNVVKERPFSISLDGLSSYSTHDVDNSRHINYSGALPIRSAYQPPLAPLVLHLNSQSNEPPPF